MPKYYITAEVTISIYVEIEAESEAEACELAADADMPHIHEDNDRKRTDGWCTSGELDGTPRIIEVEVLPHD